MSWLKDKLLIILASIAGIFVIYSNSVREKNKRLEEENNELETENNAMRTAKDVENDINSLNKQSVTDRLREKWSKK